MPSEPLITYPRLPPTTNILDSQQRTRLMRSTRKIGTVMGAMPYLVENDTSFSLLPLGQTTSKVLKRQGSIFTHHQHSSSSIASSCTSTSTTLSHRPFPSTSSITLPSTQSTDSLPINPPGLSTTRKCRPGAKAPQLYLQLGLVPILPTDERVVVPLSPPTPLIPTPVTPTVPDVAESRRKRMAKLARHLGENVPVELVFTAESVLKPATVPSGLLPRRRSLSVHVTHTEPACIGSNGPFPGQSNQTWVGEWNRPNIGDVQKELRKLRIR